jgi:hypothetical protein
MVRKHSQKTKSMHVLEKTLADNQAFHRGWRPDASGRPTKTGNVSVTASYLWPMLAS